MRSASLRRDLRVVGNDSPEALPRAPIPPLDSLSEQFGSLFVLEGSALGGQIISREVSCQLKYEPEIVCSFIASHGAEIGSMWRRVCQAAESYAAPHIQNHEAIVQSAIATFRTFGDWFERV